MHGGKESIRRELVSNACRKGIHKKRMGKNITNKFKK